MKSLKAMIHHTPFDDPIPSIRISKKTRKRLRIPTGTPLQIECSRTQTEATVHTNRAHPNTVQINWTLAQNLALPDLCPIHVFYSSASRRIIFGPVLAILVSRTSKTNPPFSKLTNFCAEMIRVARNRRVLAYVVTLNDLQRGDSFVNGWTYKNNSWQEQRFPYPQVVYNRLGPRRVDRSAQATKIKSDLIEKGIPLFNRMFLNKWEVYHQLQSFPTLLPHLPKSTLYEGKQSFVNMLEQFPRVFIKPIHGSMGRGIFRIDKKRNGYESQYSTANAQQARHFRDISALYQYVKKRTKRNRAIIQEALPILHMQDRTVDFRVLMHKNRSGKWQITSMLARIGPANRFVSNIAVGGKIQRVIAALRACGMKQAEQKREQLKKVSRRFCQALDTIYPQSFAELGVDLALTKDGRIFLLEINSKPSKFNDGVTRTYPRGRPSVHRLLDYTFFLGRQYFTNRGDGHGNH